LKGDNSIGEFYSVAVTNNFQQADTGTKMLHIGKNTRSTIISKGISAGMSQNSYRGLVKIGKGANNARNFSQCDSLLMTDRCGAHTFPYIECENSTAKIEEEKAISLIVNGYAKEVLNKLPMEFAVEAQKLLEISLEGSVG
jgi:Fe-S cluster assembly protein SufB